MILIDLETLPWGFVTSHIYVSEPYLVILWIVRTFPTAPMAVNKILYLLSSVKFQIINHNTDGTKILLPKFLICQFLKTFFLTKRE